MAELPDNGLNRRISDSEKIAKDCDAIEAEIAALKMAYEQYFLGMERQPPLKQHAELKKSVKKLKNEFVRQTAMKFRIQSIQAKVATYERLWSRTLQEIEDGTYKRDLFKARRKSQSQPSKKDRAEEKDPLEALEELDADAATPEPPVAPVTAPPASPATPAIPAVAKVATSSGVPTVPAVAKVASSPGVPAVKVASSPGAPAVPPVARTASSGAIPAVPPAAKAAPRTASSAGTPAVARSSPAPAKAAAPAGDGAGGGVSDAKLKAVYDAYVTAKKRCQEDVSKLSFESVASNLRKQVPELMKQHNASSVEFKVVIKDGKAILKAVPK